MNEEQKNPVQPTEIVASLRLVNGEWHVAIIKNQRMENVFTGKDLTEVFAHVYTKLASHPYTEGTRLVITSVIVPPEAT